MIRQRGRKGFTLVELMVVVIIVGILAAVAIPIYRSNVRKAMGSEGASLLGAVLTAEKVYYAEKNIYVNDTTVGGAAGILGVSGSGNKYFTDYTVASASATAFTATTNGRAGSDGAGITVTMTYTTAAGASIAYTGL